mgnify:FL=1
MNLQHIADFIDLVKNPVEFEKKLKILKDEQDRLNTAIETIGKATELDSLRKAVERQKVKLEQEYQMKNKEVEDNLKLALNNIEKANLDVKEEWKKVNEKVRISEQKLEQATRLQETFQGRDKELRKLEAEAAKKQSMLDTQIAEYAIKIEKLRSVMS